MIFANRNLNTFGRCKVTRWSNSLYTDFERKSVTYRGRVLAQSEAPTVRSISAEVLVIASSAFDLIQKLDAIAKWLYESGESHLISTRDLNHYYTARCTSISVPSCEGPTATFTVKFTCSDDRLFTVHGNQPVRTATEAMNNFTFAGKHCLNDMHCVFIKDKIDAVPKSTLIKYSVSGVSGTVVYDDGEEPVLSEKSLDGTLYFVKSKDDMSLMTDAEIALRMHEISAWLINARRGKLILDSDTSRYYEAEVVDKMQLSTDGWHNGCIKLSLTLQPVSVSTDESTWTESNVAINESGVTMAKELDDSTNIGFKTPFVLVLDVTSSTTVTSLIV